MAITTRALTIGSLGILLAATLGMADSGPEPFTLGEERTLRTASGPFAVAGTPDTWAMAWVERHDVLSTLWLTIVERSQEDGTRPIAGGIDPEAGILLDHAHAATAVAWSAGGSWNVAFVPGSAAPDREPRRFTIESSGTPMALAIRPDGSIVMAAADAGPPAMIHLVAIDVETGAERTLHTEPATPGTVALGAGPELLAMTWVEADTGAVRMLELDGSGFVDPPETLNVFPASKRSLRVRIVDGVSIPTWTENGPRERSLGSTGRGIVAIEGDADRRTRLVATDDAGDTLCESEVEGAEYVLAAERRALVFRATSLEDGRQALLGRSASCERADAAPSAQPTSNPSSSGLVGFDVDPGLTDPRDDTGGTTLGGSTEPCDGRDNDNDGDIDEGCDGACDAVNRMPGFPSRATNDTAFSRDASIVWTGTEYAVAWEDARGSNGPDIYFARFDASGNKIGSEVSVTPYHSFKVSYNPSLVWTGTQYGLAWRDSRDGSSEIWFETIRENGTVDDGPTQLTFKTTHLSDDPVVAWSGTYFGVAWEDNRNAGLNEIYFIRLNANGVAQTGNLRVTPDAPASNPDMVWTGSEWAIAYTRSPGSYSDVYFARLNENGTTITSNIRVTNASYHSSWPSIAWTGSEFGIAYVENRGAHLEVYMARLTEAGGILARAHQLTNHAQNRSTYPSLVWTGTEYGLAYEANLNGGEIRVARVRADGVRLGSDTTVQPSSASSAVAPDVVWNGYEFGLAYHSDPAGNEEIYFQRHGCCDDLDGDGYDECENDPNDLDASTYPGATELCDGVDNDGDDTIDENCSSTCASADDNDPDRRISTVDAEVDPPVTAWNGSEFGVAWIQGHCRVKFRRVDEHGEPLASEVELYYCNGNWLGGNLDIEWNGSEYGILVQDDADAQFFRVSSTGAVMSHTTVDGPGGDLDLVWNGTEYAAVGNSLSFLRMDRNGNQLGEVHMIGGTGYNYPEMVWNGTEYAVVYQRGTDNPRFQRLDRFGIKIGAEVTIGVTYNGPYAIVPSIAWTGTEYGVAWDDTTVWDDDDTIRFRRVATDGTLLGTELTFATSYGHSTLPSLVWTGEEFGVAWQDDMNGLDQIYFRRITAAGTMTGSRVSAMLPYSTDARSPDLVWTGELYGMVSRYRHLSAPGVYDGEYETWFQALWCCGRNEDGDPYGVCSDCDDDDDRVYPGASQVCDGVNNDCNDVNWPQLPADEIDADNDTWAVCGGDCDDDNAGVYPGANQLCNGRNDDCDDPNWPTVPPDEIDDDGDTYRECAGDCDDTLASVYPGAAQLCDGLNNDCNDGAWPAVPSTEIDDDGDTIAECAGDCDDTNATVHAGAEQLCDGLNNDCSDPNWPIVPADEADNDLDNYRQCHDDCNDADASVWATPGEVLDVRVAADKSTWSWSSPAEPGTTTLVYDTLRSDHADDFLGRGICIELDDGSDTQASDTDRPFPTQTYYYLVRAQNECPDGDGTLGFDHGGLERLGRSCP